MWPYKEHIMNYEKQMLSELAISVPRITEVFRKHRLDFCCGGMQTLKDACEKKQLNLQTIIDEIQKLHPQSSTNEFCDIPLSELTKYIVSRYHEDLRKRIPELIFLAEKVERVHKDHGSCPHGLTEQLNLMNTELAMHMMKEENVLFPLISSNRGNMAMMPIKVMTMEHDQHGKQLEALHQLTNDFTPPEGACATWRSLCAGLEDLEKELMEHIHLENNILFPRALA